MATKKYLDLVAEYELGSTISQDKVEWKSCLRFFILHNLKLDYWWEPKPKDLKKLGIVSKTYYEIEAFVNDLETKFFYGETMEEVEQETKEYIEKVKELSALVPETKTVRNVVSRIEEQ